MSICPRKDLLSAYIDGELPSPWKEDVARHVQQCPACRKIHNSYSAVHRIMRDVTQGTEFDSAALYDRICRTRGMQKKMQMQKQQWLVSAAHRFFSSSVSIPAPALAAALVLFVFIQAVFFFRSEPPRSYKNIAHHTPFTPILPLSIAKHGYPSNVGYGITSTSGIQRYSVSAQAVTANTKLFTVREFARLYSKNETLFEPPETAVGIRFSTSSFPLFITPQLLDVPFDGEVSFEVPVYACIPISAR